MTKKRYAAFIITAILTALMCLTPVFADDVSVDGAVAADEIVAVEGAAAVEEGEDIEYTLDIGEGINNIVQSTGFVAGDWRQYVMIGVGCVLLYLAIVKKFEPLLLLPIGFGMLLANLPLAGLMNHETFQYFPDMEQAVAYATQMDKDLSSIVYGYSEELGAMAYRVPYQNAGLLYYLYQGVKLGIYPPLIFMGVGAMTDFAPLIANPKSLLLG
ncbi:MAG: sodium ion-translocating decarboxylase subunit beta, partial [Clostridia bacterium]|nr:sodium ion-translocating decarboxylase subunit beta [Clostridia bacterium]